MGGQVPLLAGQPGHENAGSLAQVSPEIEAHCCQLSRGVSHAEQRPPGWLFHRAGLAEGLQKDEPSGVGAI